MTDLELLVAIEDEQKYCANNVEYFIDTYCWIRDPDTPDGKTRFRLWEDQKRALREMEEHRLNIILKARQLGITWLVLGKATHGLLFKPGYTVIGLSQRDDDAMELVTRVNFMLENLPKWMVRNIKWRTTAHEITIYRKDGEPSRFRVMASTPSTGRSWTANLIILDEWAFHPWADEIFTSAYPTVNRPTGGQVIGLSTAKRQTLFHDIWNNAEQYLFHRIFLSWKADPRRDDAWYQRTLATLGKTKTMQEYPATPEEAFSAGEDAAFPEFSREIHVIEPFEIPKHWRRWMAVDNGYSDPFAWYWFAVDEDGQVYVYREYSRTRDEEKVYYTDQGKMVKQLSTYTELENGQPVEKIEKIDYIVAGLDAWNTHHRDQSGKSLIDYYREGGIDFTGFIKAVTDRRLRKATVHEYLKPVWDENLKCYHTKVKIFSTCRHLIDTLPSLLVDEKDPEMVADCDIDNQYDAFGYGLIAYHAKHSVAPKKPMSRLRRYKERKAKGLNRPRRIL